MTSETQALLVQALTDAKWLQEFVRGHVGMTGYCWAKQRRAEQHTKDVEALLAQNEAMAEALRVVQKTNEQLLDANLRPWGKKARFFREYARERAALNLEGK